MSFIFSLILQRWNFFRNLPEKPFIKGISRFLNEHRILVKVSCLSVLSALALTICLMSAHITFGFDVNYMGKTIATVKSPSTFDTAKRLAIDSVENTNNAKIIESPKFRFTLTVTDRLNDATQLADAIINNTDCIVKGYALIVNGEEVACTRSKDAEEFLKTALNRFNIEGAHNEPVFVDEVTLKRGNYLKKDMAVTEDFETIVNNLQVKTIATHVIDVSIPFSTKTVSFASELRGYREVVSRGSNGTDRVNETIEMINGEIVNRIEHSRETISYPVQQVIAVGTARSPVTSFQQSQNFIKPLNPGTFVVTSWYNEKRTNGYHKGIDLGAKSGTHIFAVSSGTVIQAGWHKDYGYNLTIDHGNGVKTRYAHANALNVKAGDTVNKGDLVAWVGSTGMSTGPHLHFEVIVNGAFVDPAPYIGV